MWKQFPVVPLCSAIYIANDGKLGRGLGTRLIYTGTLDLEHTGHALLKCSVMSTAFLIFLSG